MHREDDTYYAFMLDYASGALPPGLALAAEIHMEMTPEAQSVSRMWDLFGGALLDELSGSYSPISNRRSSLSSPPNRQRLATHDIFCAIEDGPKWNKSILSGADIKLLGSPEARLIRLSPGRKVPHHSHNGLEATVVLEGIFADETGEHGPGDITFSDETVSHSPYVIGENPCICYVGRPPSFTRNCLAAVGIHDL